jgi:Matrixin
MGHAGLPVVAEGAALTFLYNHTDAPPMVSVERVVMAIHRAAEAWSPCGVHIILAGEAAVSAGVADGHSVIGWTKDRIAQQPGMASDIGGVAYRRGRNGKLVEVDVVLNRWNVRTASELASVFTHEFGHAVVLGPSSDRSSIMRPSSSYADMDVRPTRADIANCRAEYSGPAASAMGRGLQ